MDYNKVINILKTDNMQQIVYGVVLEPDTVDAQNDIISVSEIEKAAHAYLVKSRTIGKQHTGAANAEVLESYIAPIDFYLNGQSIKKGSWIMGVHVIDSKLWEAVQNGNITGFSIGGRGKRRVADV